MSIQLTTAVECGAMHGQSPVTYNEVKVVAVGINLWEKEIAMTVQYGNTVDGDWEPGIVPTIVYVINNKDVVVDGDGNEITPADPEYDLFIASSFPSDISNLLYDEIASSLYQHLLDEGIYAGTINA